MNEISPKILIVDDEIEFVTTLLKRLRKRGIQCEGVYTAVDGISKAVEYEFDVAVFDVRLPGMSGIDALRTLKMCRPNMNIIILTGHASASIGRECLIAGAFEYLLKPVEFETFIERLVAAHAAGYSTKARGSPEQLAHKTGNQNCDSKNN